MHTQRLRARKAARRPVAIAKAAVRPVYLIPALVSFYFIISLVLRALS